VLRTALSVTIACTLASAATAHGLSPAQPAPVNARPGHGVALCPGPTGLQPFTAATRAAARRAAAGYGRVSLAADLHNADRAWWPHVRTLWRATAAHRSRNVVLGSQPARSSGFSVFLRPACGPRTVARSLLVTVGPSQAGPGPHCNACNAHLFYVSRAGRPLLWYVY
jgi:hypothetical protein